MLQDVDVAVVRTDLEDHVFRTVPLIQHFLDHVFAFVQSETNRAKRRRGKRPSWELHDGGFNLSNARLLGDHWTR